MHISMSKHTLFEEDIEFDPVRRGPKPSSSAPAGVIEIEDDPVARKDVPVVPPIDKRPRCNDKRTKDQLLEVIEELEAKIESNVGGMSHQHKVDNQVGKELYEKTKAERDELAALQALTPDEQREKLKAERDEARAELAKAREDLATQKKFIDGLADKLDKLYKLMASVHQEVQKSEVWQKVMRELNKLF